VSSLGPYGTLRAMSSMASRSSGRGRQGVSPPPVVLPNNAELACVAREAIAGMHRQAEKNSRRAFTTEELRKAVVSAQPHSFYQIFHTLRGGTAPRTPLGPDSDIGERLRHAILDELASKAPTV
jgi:hypothetical protein